MTDLSSLIERLEKATGPSRDLDVEIMNALDPRSSDEKRLFGGKLYQASWGAVGQLCDHIRYFVEAPFPTSSIDAAVSLAERVSPNWQINLSIFHDTLAEASFGNREAPHARSKAPKPALAICLATLRALQSKGGEA
jgi:hypothetical protein